MEPIDQVISLIESDPNIYRYLKNCPYQILKCWKIVYFRKNQKMIRQGGECGWFFLIQKGLVDVTTMSESGRQYSHAIYKAGDYLGELEIFDQLAYCCSAVALTDVCALKISRPDFLKWISLDRSILDALVRNICAKFYTLSQKAASDSFYSLKYRLCEFLSDCIQQNDYRDKAFRLKIDKRALSSYLAVTTRSVNRVISDLEKRGILESEKGFVIIKDRQKLLAETERSRTCQSKKEQ